MPPLVGIAVAAAASSGAVGALFGLSTSIAGAIAGGVAEALDASIVIGDAVAGAAVGAVAGGAQAAAAGGNVVDGLLYGAATGGLTAGLTPEVASVTGLSQDAAQAITSGVVTTGSAAAQGAPLGQALEYGAVAGVGSYAGSQLADAVSGQPAQTDTQGQTPNYGGQTPAQVEGIERASIPVGSIPPYVAPNGSSQSQPSTPGTGNAAPETVTVTGQRDLSVSPGITVGPDGKETVTVEGQKPSNVAAGGVETVTVEGQKPSNVATTSPTLLDQIASDQGTKTAEKGALEAALFSLLFPSGGGQFAAKSGSTATVPGAESGSTSGGGVVPGAIGGNTGGGTLSPAAQAALASVGQPGSNSISSPGGPLFGAPTGGRYNAWNKSSLRTDQG